MKIAVLLSGGVDSSVALALIKENIANPFSVFPSFSEKQGKKGETEEKPQKVETQKIEIEAFYLKVWLQDELVSLGNCPWEEDIDYAEQVCKKYDIPLHIVSLQNEYWEHVVKYAIDEIKIGNTPNPDVFCNTYIKFGCFLKFLEGKSFDKIVSGHYAQIKQVRENSIEKIYLKTSKDSFKDQTYFLSYLSSEQLRKTWFPLGEYTKEKVRELAKQFQLPNSERKDSQGVCFLGKIKFRDFVAFHLGEKEGDIINKDNGEIIGKHKGFWFYTIGQRQGLNLSGGPWYVVAKDTEKNTITISSEKVIEDKAHQSFYIHNCNWLTGFDEIITKHKLEKQKGIQKGIPLKVKIRHGEFFHDCHLFENPSGKYLVKLSEADQGIASGQIAVFYNNDICLGAGMIIGFSC